MATSSTRRAPPRRPRPARAGASPSAAPAKPFLRFFHSAALRKRTLSVLDALEEAGDPCVHRDALADLVVDLTSAGMDFYFIQSLKAAKSGFIVEQSASLGLAGSLQVMGSVIRSIIGRMDAPQLLSVSGSIRRLMR